MARPVIEYRGAHDFACTPAELWEAMKHFERFEAWWPAVHRLFGKEISGFPCVWSGILRSLGPSRPIDGQVSTPIGRGRSTAQRAGVASSPRL